MILSAHPFTGGPMKRTLFVLLTLTLCTAHSYAGAERNQKVDLGFNLSGLSTSSNNIGESMLISAGVSYGMNDVLALGISGAYTEVGFKANPPLGLVDGLDLRMTPIFGDIIFRVPTGELPFTPYAIFGLGVMLSQAKGTDPLLARNANTRTHDAFASKLGGGLDWQINSKWSYNFETAYVLTGARLEIYNTSTNQQIESNDLDFWYIGGGVKYLFD